MKYRKRRSRAIIEAMELTRDNFREVHKFIGLDTTYVAPNPDNKDPMLLGMHVGWFATMNAHGRGKYTGYSPEMFHEMYETAE